MTERLIKTDLGFYFGSRFLPKKRFIPLEELATVETKADNRVVMSVSSEMPCYRRELGMEEVLLHSPESVDLSRFQSGKSLILMNHNPDNYLARIDRAWLQNNYLYIEAVFRETQVLQDIRDGILKSTSIGYEIKNAEIRDDQLVITEWLALEASVVSIPMDNSTSIQQPPTQEKAYSDEEEISEELRQKNIHFIGRQFNLPDWTIKGAIRSGKDLQTFSREAQSMNRNYDQKPAAMPAELIDNRGGGKSQDNSWKSLELGLSQRDRANYSLARLLAYKAGFDVPKPSLELEASRALGDLLGKDARGLWVPIADLNWTQRSARLQRDALWTGGNGSALVETSLGEFVSLLRSKIILGQMGATILSGLTGNLDLPKMSQATTVQWIDEGSVIPETDVAFETVEMRPHTLASRLPVTRRLLLQASQNYDLELILRQDMITSIAIEADRAAINGSGIGNEPLGLLNHPDVTKLPLGTDGGQLTYDDVINLESAIATNDADIGSLAYVMSPSVRGEMKKTPVEAGTDTFTFEPLPQPDPNMPGAGYVNGYLAQAATTIPNNLTKGNGTGLSALIFGNWSDLYFGEFGAIDVSANPYGRMFPSGGVELRAMMDLSIVPRRIESFAVISDIITS